MEALILLATVMAVFGIFGYLRGMRFSIFNALLSLISIGALNQIGGSIVRLINIFYRVARAMLAGGLAAIANDSEGGFATLGELVKGVPALIGENDNQTALIILTLLIIAGGFALGALKFLKGKASYLGMALGLVNGYVLSAYLLRTLLPEAGIPLPLPAGLLAANQRGITASPLAAGPSLADAFFTKLETVLMGLANNGSLALIVALLIAVFVILAIHRGNGSVKKG